MVDVVSWDAIEDITGRNWWWFGGGRRGNEEVAGGNGNLEALRVEENKQKGGRDCDKRVTCDTPRRPQIRPHEADCAQVVSRLTHANPQEPIGVIFNCISAKHICSFVPG